MSGTDAASLRGVHIQQCESRYKVISGLNWEFMRFITTNDDTSDRRWLDIAVDFWSLAVSVDLGVTSHWTHCCLRIRSKNGSIHRLIKTLWMILDVLKSWSRPGTQFPMADTRGVWWGWVDCNRPLVIACGTLTRCKSISSQGFPTNESTFYCFGLNWGNSNIFTESNSSFVSDSSHTTSTSLQMQSLGLYVAEWQIAWWRDV